MKTYTITKHNFLDWYFENNYTEESTELRLDLAEKVISLLITKNNAVITTEEIFEDCNQESIKLAYLEEFDDEDEGEVGDLGYDCEVNLID